MFPQPTPEEHMMTTTPDEAKSKKDDGEHDTTPESISTENADIEPAEREHLEIDANAFRASLKY
jgi:hypothetical protein